MDQAKIKLLTYRPKDEDRDRMLVNPLQRAMEESTQSRTPSTTTNTVHPALPTSDSRILALPFELLHQIFYYLPIEALSHLLSLSRRMYLAVTAHQAYPIILNHLRPLIRVLRLTYLLSSFSLSHLLSALYTAECAACNHATEYLFLPSLKCGCYTCIRSHDSFMPIKPSAVRRWYGLRRKDLVGVPQMRTLVGTYCQNPDGLDEWRSQRDILMDGGLIQRKTVELGKFKEAPVVSLRKVSPSMRRPLASIHFPSMNPQTGEEEIYVRCAGCWQVLKKAVDDQIHRGIRYGHLNFRGEVEDKGTFRLESHSWLYYTRKGWLAHFEECKKSQEMWRNATESESKPPALIEHARLKATFLMLRARTHMEVVISNSESIQRRY